MGETRSQMDNASVSSEDSVKVPTRQDTSKLKAAGPLPAEEFDPLKHNEWEKFWHQIDFHFHPVNLEHLGQFRHIPVNPYNGLNDADLRVTHPMDLEVVKPNELREKKRDAKRESKREKSVDEIVSGKRPAERAVSHSVKGENSAAGIRSTSSINSEVGKVTAADADCSTVRASLNSYPFTHRLVAALMDDNDSGTPAPTIPQGRPNRAPMPDEVLWTGVGNDTDVNTYRSVMEERVKYELNEHGLLLDEKNDDEVQTAIRQAQWKLRPLKTANRLRKEAIFLERIVSEMRKQAIRREEKRHEDSVEMAYLERMVNKMKKNKKSRSKFQKLLQRMFGHYKEKDKNNDKGKKGAAESMSNGRAITNGDVRSSGKKKKKKISHDLPAKSATAHAVLSRKSAP